MGTRPVLVDENPDVVTVDGLDVLHGAEGQAALARCDVVVKTPGISRYRPEVKALEALGVPVTGGLGLFMQEARRDRVTCITGTKGKSTTTAIAGHLLERLGYRALVAGNIGLPPWDPDVGDDHDWWVVETSSFQVTDLGVAPAVVAVTSLHPDHLDWHGDAETYFADKLSLCTLPGEEVTVADGASTLLRQRAAQLGTRITWIDDESARRADNWATGLGLRGPHNRRNAEIARSVLEALRIPEARDVDALAAAAQGFDGLPSRLRTVATVGGVEFVDDSLSTNVLPALAALDTFADRRVALLVGGHDRGLDYEPLADGIAAREMPTLVVTMPDCGPRIGKAVAARGATQVETVDASDLRTAVHAAYRWCQPDGVVLLSPAAPSFGQFRDYRERASAFVDAAHACGT
jgi:UDP-N-acetylmuramoylalanine--D-glutamate ligase